MPSFEKEVAFPFEFNQATQLRFCHEGVDGIVVIDTVDITCSGKSSFNKIKLQKYPQSLPTSDETFLI